MFKPVSILFGLGLVLGMCSPSSATAEGAEIIRALQSEGAFSRYMEGRVRRIASQLFGRLARVNQAYSSSHWNLYIVEPSAATRVLSAHGLPQLGRAVSFEEHQIVLLNDAHIKELVVLATLVWERGMKTSNAVAQTAVEGMGAYRAIWDPRYNERLNSDEVMRWEIAFRGAIAFLLAHEVAHLEMGQEDPASIRRSTILTTSRDRDLQWMCPDLVHERALQHRRIEQEADTRAVRRLARHRIGGSRLGRFEVGSEWYALLLAERRFVCAANSASDAIVRYLLIPRFGERITRLLRSDPPGYCTTSSGVVRSFYPSDHPSSLTRLMTAADNSDVRLLQVFAARVEQECRELQERNR